jgi:alginate O-acetyltransferase complex protein AlgI
MLFNSLEFALFFPVVTGIYYLLRHRGQNLWLLVASLFFYASWDWRFLPILATTMVVDFYVAGYLEKLAKVEAPERKRKLVLAISMGANLAMLGFFKYFNFFIDSFHSGLLALHISAPISTLSILLPIGISFYTFQSMSYTIDVYRRELPACRHFLDFALFVSFYPHLVAGPIMRAVDLLPQILSPRHTSRKQVLEGIHLMIWGLWKKMFIADNLAPLVNGIFSETAPTGFHTLIGVYAFAFQIYCDFSGYTDVARGVAKLMGFELVLNFNLPYFSTSPQEFWTRWHISLSSWLRNYLYFPLGGSRDGEAKTYRNLMITMLLGGLWHGAAWNFVLWGAYQGTLLVIHRALQPKLDKIFDFRTAWARAASLTFRILVMFQLTCFGWLLFRAPSFTQIVTMTASLSHPFQQVDKDLAWQVVGYAGPLVVIQCWQYFSKKLMFLANLRPLELRIAAYSVLLYLMLFRAAKPQAFIYFQF